MPTEDITDSESLTGRQDAIAESAVPGPDLDDDTRVSPRQWPFTLTVILASVGLSLSEMSGVDIGFAYEDEHIWRGELWRFILSVFVHGDPFHLLGGMYWLAQFGQPIERRFGSTTTMFLFFALCLGSGAPEFLLADGGIGMSGVLYGYFGVLLVARRRDPALRNALDRRTIVWFAAWTVFCIAASWADIWAVGNIAHVSGAIFGVLLGLSLYSQRRWLGHSACAIVAMALTAATLYMPWNFHWWWDRAGRQFEAERYAEAHTWYNRAYLLSPQEAEADLLVNLAMSSLQLDRFGEAVMWYKEAIRVSIDPGPIRADLAHAYYVEGDEDRAQSITQALNRSDFDEFLSSDPDFMALTPFASTTGS